MGLIKWRHLRRVISQWLLHLLIWSEGASRGDGRRDTAQRDAACAAALSSMAQIILRHLIETPVRYQEQFEARGLEDCRLDHALFALPGPTTVDLGRAGEAQAPAGDAAAEAPARGGKARFQVLLDVVQFLPEDIIIQTFEGWLLIKAQHGTRMDEHGFISRSFTRQYRLPEGVKTGDLSALLCHDGILVVEVKDPAGTQ